MATAWLAKVLSTNQNMMKCFHGSIGVFPTYSPSRALNEVVTAIDAWGVGNSVTHCGCVHLSLSHGVSAGPYCVKNGISFCGLVRNPILAIESQYGARMSPNSPESRTVGLPDKSVAWAAALPNLEFLLTGLTEDRKAFLQCAIVNLKHTRELELMHGPVFEFEKYTTDYDEMRKVVRCITREHMDNDPEIFEAFSNMGKVNTHRDKKLSAQETWEKGWSDWQRNIFAGLWQHYYPNNERALYPEIVALLACD